MFERVKVQKCEMLEVGNCKNRASCENVKSVQVKNKV